MKNKYCFGEFVSNIFALIITKLFYKPARLIRRPLYLRGRKSFIIGKGLTIGHACRFDLDGKEKTLFVGSNCQFGDNTHIVALKNIHIGDNVLIASKVFISDTSHGVYNGPNQDSPAIPPDERELEKGTVIIGNNVWIGENAVILKGSNIGDGCIIGANAIISKNIPPYSMVVSSNQIIKTWDFEKKEWVSNKK